jgi:3-methyladenine DNA glycosylase AlkD
MTEATAIRPSSPAHGPQPSPTTARAVAFVAAHKPEAEALGVSLADHVGDPDAFATALRAGLERLSDPEYLEGMQFVAPGIGTVHGVRRPLLEAVARGFRHETRGDRATTLLFLADRLFHEPHMEARWFAFGLLERTLAADPERTWQLLRRAAREANDWVTVDDLAHQYGIGIDAERYRWAELEQLVYSPSRWERRLIGSTIATMTHGRRRSGRAPELVPTALRLLEALMGETRRSEGPCLGISLPRAGRSRCDDRSPPGRGGSRGHPRRRPPRLGHPGQPLEAGACRRRRPARSPGRHPQAARRPVDLDRSHDRRAIRCAARSGDASRATTHLTLE